MDVKNKQRVKNPNYEDEQEKVNVQATERVMTMPYDFLLGL